MMDAIIELDEHDDLHTVRDRLATAGAEAARDSGGAVGRARAAPDGRCAHRAAFCRGAAHRSGAIVSPDGEVRTTVRETGLPVLPIR